MVRLRRTLGCLIAPAVVAVHAATASPQVTIVQVSTPSAFEAALDSAAPGSVIQLTNGDFPSLAVSGRVYDKPVHIVGSGSTNVGGFDVFRSKNISIENLSITPTAGAAALLSIARDSSNVNVSNVHFDGRDEGLGAAVNLDQSVSAITIADSDFTNCGLKLSVCILAHGTGIAVLRTKFHDLIDSDGIRGVASDVTISDSTFQRAVPGRGGNHNDFIQIMGGGPWSIQRDRFGERTFGAAQVYVDPRDAANPVHDVSVKSSYFFGEMYVAVQINAGATSSTPPPQNVSIVNNTILSGTTVAVRVAPGFAGLSAEQRPLVANDVLAVSNQSLCTNARTSHNVVEKGQVCGEDHLGDPHLDSNGRPTSASRLLIKRADPNFAPKTDLDGKLWRGIPDIGAFAFRGRTPQTKLSLTAPRTLSVRRAALRSQRWRLAVPLSFEGVSTLRATLSWAGHHTTLTQRVHGKSQLVFYVTIPRAARASKRLLLVFRGTAPDGRKVSRTVFVRLTA